jgi:hypothetical protein
MEAHAQEQLKTMSAFMDNEKQQRRTEDSKNVQDSKQRAEQQSHAQNADQRSRTSPSSSLQTQQRTDEELRRQEYYQRYQQQLEERRQREQLQREQQKIGEARRRQSPQQLKQQSVVEQQLPTEASATTTTMAPPAIKYAKDSHATRFIHGGSRWTSEIARKKQESEIRQKQQQQRKLQEAEEERLQHERRRLELEAALKHNRKHYDQLTTQKQQQAVPTMAAPTGADGSSTDVPPLYPEGTDGEGDYYDGDSSTASPSPMVL